VKIALRVLESVKACERLGSELPTDPIRGTVRKRTINTPRIVDTRMKGDFSLAQPMF
jgi:hypothetical protein